MREETRRMDAEAGAFSGAVLAGGRSRRMGRDKARLPHPDSGRPLVEHAVELLRAAGCAELLLSVRAGADYPEIGAEVTRVEDDGEGGPLPAVAAALARARFARVLVLAVDLPRMKAELLRGLVAEATETCGVAWRGARGWEPLCAVYPAASARCFAEACGAGRFSLQAMIDAGVAAGWMKAAETEADAEALANWNTPGDVG